ncbi:dTMP kinase [Thalassobaculum litoreum]|uniref:Thymidylate kinase n=1 Tax=Thalassobaculum litoreum DSM 18839 TaxID=1123362 RepID=A0A8G2F5U6_9PROT|nr:deoxynucleoside kinase [Thalassobaculum litoreum]SDG58922.1 dTMP kinase [Thalassobaculum litoreum DSM 18839]
MFKFISFEGIDGCGKTTLRNAILKRLLALGVPATSIGQNSWLSVPEAYVILSARERHQVFPAATMTRCYLADKLLHYKLNVHNLRKYGVVVSDRYYVSDIVYMHALHSMPLAQLAGEFLAESFIWPDQIYFLDVDPNVAMDRIERRGKPRRHYEQITDLQRLHDTYCTFFDQYEDMLPTELHRISNDDGALEEVVETVIQTSGILNNPRCSRTPS